MASKKDRIAKEPEQKKSRPEKSGDGGLATAASAIGSVLGALAVKTGIEQLRPADLSVEPDANKPSTRKVKLVKKNKSKLPRKQKKAAKKSAAGIHRAAVVGDHS